MVEVRCETDFVARNEHFIRLVSELAKKLNNDQTLLNHQQQSNNVEKIWITDENRLKEIGGDLVMNTIQKLGENIRFVRGCLMRISNGNQSSNMIRLLPYAHAVAGKIESNDPEIVLGKYGTIVAVTQSTPESNTVVNEDEEMDQTQVSKNIDELGS
ncbi:elongation factor Ts, mitochondrial-like protein, partial [Euroglyphus maynei]